METVSVLHRHDADYIFHHDPGHGWLAVKRAELIQLGLAEKISAYSYQKGNTVYLEEDCDLSAFLNALEANGVTKLKFYSSYKNRSPLRSYDSYNNG